MVQKTENVSDMQEKIVMSRAKRVNIVNLMCGMRIINNAKKH